MQSQPLGSGWTHGPSLPASQMQSMWHLLQLVQDCSTCGHCCGQSGTSAGCSTHTKLAEEGAACIAGPGLAGMEGATCVACIQGLCTGPVQCAPYAVWVNSRLRGSATGALQTGPYLSKTPDNLQVKALFTVASTSK